MRANSFCCRIVTRHWAQLYIFAFEVHVVRDILFCISLYIQLTSQWMQKPFFASNQILSLAVSGGLLWANERNWNQTALVLESVNALCSSCYALCWTSPLLLVVNRWCGTSCFFLCSQRHGLCLSHPLCCTAAWSLRTGYLSKCDCEIYALNNKRCMVAHDHMFLFHTYFKNFRGRLQNLSFLFI